VIVVLPDTEGERALVVVAHPDHVDFWAGGTVAGWTSTGIAVTYCVLSDGDAGFDPDVPRSAITGIRRAEQEAAAAVLGVADVRFLGYPDGCIEPSYPCAATSPGWSAKSGPPGCLNRHAKRG
jgi:LmbE family N-acetylglucosaminyl deacetylase